MNCTAVTKEKWNFLSLEVQDVRCGEDRKVDCKEGERSSIYLQLAMRIWTLPGIRHGFFEQCRCILSANSNAAHTMAVWLLGVLTRRFVLITTGLAPDSSPIIYYLSKSIL